MLGQKTTTLCGQLIDQLVEDDISFVWARVISDMDPVDSRGLAQVRNHHDRIPGQYHKPRTGHLYTFTQVNETLTQKASPVATKFRRPVAAGRLVLGVIDTVNGQAPIGLGGRGHNRIVVQPQIVSEPDQRCGHW